MKYILLLLAHFIGDYLFPFTKLEQRSVLHKGMLILRSLIYSCCILLALCIFMPLWRVLVFWILIGTAHAIADFVCLLSKQKVDQKSRNSRSAHLIVYVTARSAIILIVMICGYFLGPPGQFGAYIFAFLLKHLTWIQLFNGLIVLLMLMICSRPTAEFIKNVFISLSFQDDLPLDQSDAQNKSGYIIGILERIIILILGFKGQLGAIGFVLAAKSLARYKQLEDQLFAEKYLIGTLLSAAISLTCVAIGQALWL